MKRLYTFLIIALMSSAANAQGWLPWDHDPSISNSSELTVASLAEGDTLTIAYSSNGIKVQQFNGISWSPLPAVGAAYANDTVRELMRYQGDLFLLTKTKLLRLDGQNWTNLSSAGAKRYTDMDVYNGDLVFGAYEDWGVWNVVNLFAYDGSSVSQYPGAPTGLDSVGDIHIHNNEMFLAGRVGTSSPRALIKYDGSSWTELAQFTTHAYTNTPIQAFHLNNRLFLIDVLNVNEVRNDSIVPVATLPNPARFHREHSDVKIFNDTAYLGTRVNGNNQPLIFDGQSVTALPGSPTNVTSFIQYKGDLLLFGPSSASNLVGINAMIWSKNPNAASIASNIFYDINGNCSFDAGDSLLNQHFISFNNGQFIFTPNKSKNSIIIPAGTYSLDSVFGYTHFYKYFTPACNWPTSVTLAAQQADTLEFPLSLQNVNDVSVQMIPFRGWSARHGFTETYEVVVRNLAGNTLNNLSLDLNHDPGLNLVAVAPSPSSTTSTSMSWTISRMLPLEESRFLVKFLVDTAEFSVGDKLHFDAQVVLQGDVDMSNNQDSLIQSVTAALDPNDKQASSERILPGTKRIDYHIRFQNTGNDTAYKVTVVDTLDMSLPITKIMINSASHDYNLRVDDNILIWEFDNILLPDSATDEAGSQGYIRFSAGLNPSLGVGDTIDNDAEIYFDYQPPVHTNHAKTAIVSKISLREAGLKPVQLEVFPNPASEEIHLQNLAKQPIALQLIDQSGRLVDIIQLKGTQEQVYSIRHLPVGTYFLKFESHAFQVIVR